MYKFPWRNVYVLELNRRFTQAQKSTQHKKRNFPLRISSVNVVWSHLLKKSLMGNFIFFAMVVIS